MSDASITEWAAARNYGVLHSSYRSHLNMRIIATRLITAAFFGLVGISATTGLVFGSVLTPFLVLLFLVALPLSATNASYDTGIALSFSYLYFMFWGIIWDGPRVALSVPTFLLCGLFVAVLVGQVRAFTHSIVRVVYIFEHGVVVEGSGKKSGILWEHVTELSGWVFRNTLRYKGLNQTIRMDHKYLVVGEGDVSLPLHSTGSTRIEGIDVAWSQIQTRCNPFLLSRAITELEEKGTVRFGSLTVTDLGVESTSTNHFHSWRRITSIKLHEGYLTIQSTWGGPNSNITTTVSAGSISNLDTFMTLSRQLRPTWRKS